MGHAHRHAAADGGPPDLGASPHTRRTLALAVGACALATLVGLDVLWPRGPEPEGGLDPELTVDYVDATVREVGTAACAGTLPTDDVTCDQAAAEVTSGPTEGETAVLEFPTIAESSPELEVGDEVVLTYVPDSPPEFRYSFADFQRSTPLLALAVLFAVAVVVLGRLQGVRALVGLAVSLGVILAFLLPALLGGASPLAVALAGASVIAFGALYLTHGFNPRTTVALLGTLASLVLTVGLAVAFVSLAELTGLADEDATFLQLSAGQVDLRGLLLAGIVIGTLGVLDDVTVTQVSAVGEIHAADPSAPPRRTYASALRVGRDHIASTVNTLVLAYVGAALPLLILLSTQSQRSFSQVLTSEVVAVEIVRTLVGSIGLVASVPITTALAVAVVAGSDRSDAAVASAPGPAAATARRSATSRRRPVRAPSDAVPGAEAAPPPDPPPPSWDDFAPREDR